MQKLNKKRNPVARQLRHLKQKIIKSKAELEKNIDGSLSIKKLILE